VLDDKSREEVTESPHDYREMLDRARSKQTEASLRTDLEQAVAEFRQKRSRLPTNLYELISSGVMTEIPKPPEGKAFSYDPVQGNVGLMPAPDGSGIELPDDMTNVAPVRLENVPLPDMP